MFKKLKKSESEGFTIIEVVIVLAIAAMILLIVLLAVPALQRNSRNTQRKNDVTAILASTSEFISNNSGLLPNGALAWTNAGGVLTVQSGAANTASTQARLGYFNVGIGVANGDVSHAANGTATAAGTLNTAAEDHVIVATGTDCQNGASIAGASRSVTAVYEIENGANSYQQQCQST